MHDSYASQKEYRVRQNPNKQNERDEELSSAFYARYESPGYHGENIGPRHMPEKIQ